MYRKKKKKAWIWILIGLIVILVAGGLVYYKEVVRLLRKRKLYWKRIRNGSILRLHRFWVMR